MKFSNFITESLGVQDAVGSLWYVYYIYEDSKSGIRGSNVIFCKSAVQAETEAENVKERDAKVLMVDVGLCDASERLKIRKILDKLPPNKLVLKGE